MHKYFIAIVIPPELNEKILKFKNMMLERFGCKVGLKSPAHITIVPPFWMNEENEQQLAADLTSICSTLCPFTIATNNFSAFKPRTIFIDILNNEHLALVKTKAEDFLSGTNTYKIKKENRAFHPHITIATRDLQKKCFYEAWPLFSDKTFQAAWVASGLSLLRHDKKKWDVVYTSHFDSADN